MNRAQNWESLTPYPWTGNNGHFWAFCESNNDSPVQPLIFLSSMLVTGWFNALKSCWTYSMLILLAYQSYTDWDNRRFKFLWSNCQLIIIFIILDLIILVRASFSVKKLECSNSEHIVVLYILTENGGWEHHIFIKPALVLTYIKHKEYIFVCIQKHYFPQKIIIWNMS